MDTTAEIERFLRDIRRRNRREIIVGIILLPVFGFFAATAPVGSLAFFGHLLILLAILFNVGVMWFVAKPRGTLNGHPATDVEHWTSEILRQTKLLRRVPLWGLAPFLPGLALLLWPSVQGPIILSVVAIGVVVLAFGIVGWLNLKEALKLEQQASGLKKA